MDKRVYAKTTPFRGIEKNPTLLGFGCMRFPTLVPGKPEIDEVRAAALIDAAYQAGVTYFDTAWVYHRGTSETFLGKVLKKYPRDSFFLADKMPGWELKTVEDAERIFAEQLNRCQVDYFDFYLCHALSKEGYEAYRIPGVMAFLERMKAEGKIRHLGFSFHDSPEVLEEILNDRQWDFTQIQLNYLDWDFQKAKKQYALLESRGIPVVVMEPVRGGLLATLSEDARQIFLAADPDKSVASWAIRFAASRPGVMTVLSGMTEMPQVVDNLKTMTVFRPLSPAEEKTVFRALSVFLKNVTIPCTACRYCMPCPHGVEIPTVFRVANEYRLNHWKGGFVEDYEAIPESGRAEACVACGECMKHCPQKIAIPDRMKEIAALYRDIKAERAAK